MQKIVIFQLFLLLTLLSGREIENEIGINIGVNSTENESGFKLKNPTIGITYQDNRYMVMPRVDLEYTNVKGDYANSLLNITFYTTPKLIPIMSDKSSLILKSSSIS